MQFSLEIIVDWYSWKFDGLWVPLIWLEVIYQAWSMMQMGTEPTACTLKFILHIEIALSSLAMHFRDIAADRRCGVTKIIFTVAFTHICFSHSTTASQNFYCQGNWQQWVGYKSTLFDQWAYQHVFYLVVAKMNTYKVFKAEFNFVSSRITTID